jgi:hypothetical protein
VGDDAGDELMAESTVLYGQEKVARDLALIRERLATMAERLPLEVQVIEQGERDLFGSLMGKYQNTGTLMASLTQSGADGAIRRYHGNVLEFGTSIWYGRFQTRIGPPSGKPRGRKRPLPVKVLKLTPAMRASAAEMVLGHLFEGIGVG